MSAGLIAAGARIVEALRVSGTTKVLLGAIVALTMMLGVTHCRLAKVLERSAATALRADSAAAALDTTRRLELGQVLGDSLAAFARRSIQQPQLDDAVDRALRAHGVELRRAMTVLEATVDRLAVQLASSGSPVEDTAGTRRARFTIDEPAYQGTADVTVPRPPAAATLDLDVGVRPVVIDLRHGCGPVSPDGIRPAIVNATTPRWLTLTFRRVEQDPGVCPSPALTPRRSRWYDHVFLGPGVGVVIAPNGRAYGGAGASAGVDLLWLLRR